jgi:hypothetical protein
MAAQQNLLRALKLIRLLKQRPGKTLPQLAQLLDCDPRHARRFLDTLEEVGFFVEKEGKRPPRFFLFEDEVLRPHPTSKRKNQKNLALHFSIHKLCGRSILYPLYNPYLLIPVKSNLRKFETWFLRRAVLIENAEAQPVFARDHGRAFCLFNHKLF